MSTLIYQDKHGFRIVRAQSRTQKGYIVVNSRKPFEEGHSHINNFYMCKKVIHCVRTGTIDERLNLYLLRSLIRLSKDRQYQKRVQDAIDRKQSEKKASLPEWDEMYDGEILRVDAVDRQSAAD